MKSKSISDSNSFQNILWTKTPSYSNWQTKHIITKYIHAVHELQVEVGELKGRLTEVISNCDGVCKRIVAEGPESLQSSIKPFTAASTTTSFSSTTSLILWFRILLRYINLKLYLFFLPLSAVWIKTIDKSGCLGKWF